MGSVPELRIRRINEHDVQADGDYVLYWMIAYRRGTWNFSLQHAVETARQLERPLLVFEPLRCGYRWASDRLHQFVIQGMADNARHFAQRAAVTYYPYLEQEAGAGKGLLAALAKRACLVVSDDYPCFFLPRMVAAAAGQVPVAFDLVDSNGILPLRAADKVFARAHDFRRFMQKTVRDHLDAFPDEDPVRQVRLPKLDGLPAAIRRQWPAADVVELAEHPDRLADFPIDHDVKPTETAGGSAAAQATLARFISSRLARYNDDRNEPEAEATSGLSPYLHFGHVSAHQVFHDVMLHDGWSPNRLAAKASGSASDWWGASAEVESFLDELITWREVGFNMCWQRDDFDRYESLPEWARTTLEEHARDRREHCYSLFEFEQAQTHNELWNAAQRQLIREGRIHNYLRMVWGKKILHWTKSPRAALEIMIELNNKYALDGRDPNSYSGIFWCLGRYDRAWGPERDIFGKIRYMTTENTARKVNVKGYLQTYGPAG